MSTLSSVFFALAMLAGVLSGHKGTQADLQKLANQEIPARLAQINAEIVQKGKGNYVHLELAWGPVVYQAPHSNVADNVMYVVKNTAIFGGYNQYTVAIAGTNFDSPFDWLIEDGGVWATVPWDENRPSTGHIALGTSIALQTLKSLKSVPTIPANSTQSLTLREYLKQQLGDKKKAKIYVTGHSLGGALSPVVGLWLNDHATDWPNAGIEVYAFAGPTPGDATFAKYYQKKLTNTLLVWNQLDAVPHAWQQKAAPQLSQIPGLYESLPDNGKVSPGKDVNDFIDVLKYISSKTAYTQVGTNPGFIDSTKYADVTACTSDLSKFLVQAVYQHINAYAAYYNITVKTLLPCPLAKETEDDFRTKVQLKLASIPQKP